MNIRWVQQEDPYGCGIACIAMITGRSYAEAKASLPHPEHLVRTGMPFKYLSDIGYVVDSPTYEAKTWPPEPFAGMHLCEVHVGDAPHGHMVVMLADGAVLDPLTTEPRTLRDYEAVYIVAAITPPTVDTAGGPGVTVDVQPVTT
jgi:hypothetical protein